MNTKNKYTCPKCGHIFDIYRNPSPVVDIIIEIDNQIVLIDRKNQPYGWAIPGGFVDYGETVEHAAVREAKEETSLNVELLHLLGVYSDPSRDIRMHTISTVFVAKAWGEPRGADDAKQAKLFKIDDLPAPIVFDHDQILRDYFTWKQVQI